MYLQFRWVIESSGWDTFDNLEDAKKEWCMGMILWKMNGKTISELMQYGSEVKSNRAILKRIYELGYKPIHRDGVPFSWHVEDKSK